MFLCSVSCLWYPNQKKKPLNLQEELACVQNFSAITYFASTLRLRKEKRKPHVNIASGKKIATFSGKVEWLENPLTV